MFGIIFTAIVGMAKVIHSIGIIAEDEKSKSEAIKRGEDTYCDHRGAIRWCSTGEYYRRKMVNGEDCLVGDDGRIIRNLDQGKRNKNEEIYRRNKELAIKNGSIIFGVG